MDNYVIFTAQNVDNPSELMGRYPSDLPNKYYHHSTNRFGRQPFDEREGEPMRLHITGRLRNDRVDALVVDNPNSDNEIPHITLATADGVKPFASNAELMAHGEDIEPLDDYVDTTFRNNMSGNGKNNESIEHLRRFVNECVRSILYEKRGGHNYADNGDEYYTREEDICRELTNYDFSGMVVYCNCDNPSSSNFYKYFKDNYSKLGLRGLYATWYSDKPSAVYFNGSEERTFPIKSGRFQDNAEIMEKCDVVVTNPPFSGGMPRHLLNMTQKMGKHLVMVGPLHMSRNKEVFNMVKDGGLKMGYTPINRYNRETGESGNTPTVWWTTMPVKRGAYHSGKSYDPSRYQKMDNFDAINCDRYDEIPDDYEGDIAVPWRFLSKHNPDQYEIVGQQRGKIGDRNTDTRLVVKKKTDNFAESVTRRLFEMIKG